MRRLQLIPQLTKPRKRAACHILIPPGRHSHKPLYANSLKFRKLARVGTNLIGRKASLRLLTTHIDLNEHTLGAGELACLNLADSTARDRLRQMQRTHRVNQLG